MKTIKMLALLSVLGMGALVCAENTSAVEASVESVTATPVVTAPVESAVTAAVTAPVESGTDTPVVTAPVESGSATPAVTDTPVVTAAVSKLGKLCEFASKQVEKAGKGLTSAKDWMKQQVPSTEAMSKWLGAQVELVKNNPKKSIAIAVSAVYVTRTLYNLTRAPKQSGNLPDNQQSNSWWKRLLAALPSPFETNGTGIFLR